MFIFYFDENRSEESAKRYAGRRDNLSERELREVLSANLINGIDLDTPIYRICSYASLMEMFEDKRLRFSRPDSWDDPYENYYLRYKVDVDGELVKLKDLGRSIFAQCWSLEPESDGLWRNFGGGKHKLSVQIESTVWDVMRELYDFQADSPNKKYYCGKVSYVSSDDIDRELKAPIKSDYGRDWSTRRAILRTLMTKRLPFAYEQEVRFVFIRPSMISAAASDERWRAKNKWNYNQNVFHVKIEPEKCIKKVKIAPWVDKKTAEIMTRAICEYGFNPAMVLQSKLYDRPGLRVNGKRAKTSESFDKIYCT